MVVRLLFWRCDGMKDNLIEKCEGLIHKFIRYNDNIYYDNIYYVDGFFSERLSHVKVQLVLGETNDLLAIHINNILKCEEVPLKEVLIEFL